MSNTRKKAWTADDIPDQSGRVAIVTGANTGLGFEAARELAGRGANVVLAVRDTGKGEAALARIRSETPAAAAAVMALDLADLASVEAFAADFLAAYDRLDILLNNAGIMFAPYGKTKDGLEQQLGVNHLGHFALTGRLLERLLETSGSRIVNVSSVGHRMGSMDFDDLLWVNGGYRTYRAYGRSKLANLLFTYELQRRLKAIDTGTMALVAHPGGSLTELGRHVKAGRFGRLYDLAESAVSQSAAMGALPELRAATDPNAIGGQYYGPDGFAQMRGNPVLVESNGRSHDSGDAERLWQASEETTGVRFKALDDARG